MRILYCPEYFFPHVGGAEVWLFYTSIILSKKGHDVTVITYKHPLHSNNEVINGVKVRRVGIFPIKGIQPYFKRALINAYGILVDGLKIDYDIIISNQTFPLLPSYIVSKLRRKPLMAVFHDIYGLNFSIKEKGLFKGLIRGIVEVISTKLNYDLILTVSNSTKSKLLKTGVSSEKIFVVGGGVDIKAIDSVYAEKSSKPMIIYVGRLVKLKKVENLIIAFKEVLSKIPNAELYIVGIGPQESMLKNLVEQLKIASKVHFTGYVSEEEKIALMKHAWVLVQPSVAEGFGLVLVEANACKTPVIAVDSGGPREVVRDGETGYLIKPNNIKMLVEKLVELLSDKNRILVMGEKGRKLVEENFTWDKVAEKIEKIMLDYLKQK
jgi:glycosyltransferase involved in cell wall biosynthesis